jgi:hypothetical protein
MKDVKAQSIINKKLVVRTESVNKARAPTATFLTLICQWATAFRYFVCAYNQHQSVRMVFLFALE